MPTATDIRYEFSAQTEVMKLCPEWGSNPHWEDFKSSASAIGLSGPREKQSLLGAKCSIYQLKL